MLNELIKSIRDVSMESSINVCDAIVGMINKNELVQEYDNECVFGDVIMESMMIFMESKNRERDRTPRNEISKWMEKNNLWYTGNNPNKKKFSNRIYHFLQQHDFNPADGTYRTDIKLKDGTYKRIKLNIEINGRIPLTQSEKKIFNQWKKNYVTKNKNGKLHFDWDKIFDDDRDDDDSYNEKAELNLYDKLRTVAKIVGGKNASYKLVADEIYLSIDTIKDKQAISQLTLKHEEGHANDFGNDDKSKQDLEEIDKIKSDSDKHRKDAFETRGMRGNNHDDKSRENYADAYSAKHAKIRTRNDSTRDITNKDMLKHFQYIDRSLSSIGRDIDTLINYVDYIIKTCNRILSDTGNDDSLDKFVRLSDRVYGLSYTVDKINRKRTEVEQELSILGKTDNELMKLQEELRKSKKSYSMEFEFEEANKVAQHLELVKDYLNGFKPANVEERKKTLQNELQKTEQWEKSRLKKLENKIDGDVGYKSAFTGRRIALSLSNKDIAEIFSKAKTEKEANTMILNKLKPAVKRIRDKLVKAKSNLEETKKLDNRIKDVSTRVRYEFAKKYVKEYFEELSIDYGYYD